jgi:agmatinase
MIPAQATGLVRVSDRRVSGRAVVVSTCSKFDILLLLEYAQLADLDALDSGGYNVPLAANPFDSWATVIDCGDVPVTSYDPKWAIHQIEEGHNSILMRDPATHADEPGLAKKDKTFPRVITMGGDHSITLPLLRSMNRAYGPVTVIHFDSHLDTWKPKVFGGAPSKVASINHGE